MEYWLKLYEKFLKWEWYKVDNVKSIFIHLMLKANKKDGRWQGMDVKRSQHITSLKTLSDDTGLSIAQVRGALSKLKKTKEITDESHSKFRLITVLNYEHYQGCSKQDDKQVAIKSQTSNKQVATIQEGKRLDIKNIESGEKISPTPSQKSKKFFLEKNFEPYRTNLIAHGSDEKIIDQELLKFWSYWTEKNKSGSKQKWEMQKTFEIERRISTWMSNVNQFKKPEKEHVQFGAYI